MRQSRFTVEEIIRIIAEPEFPTSSIAGSPLQKIFILKGGPQTAIVI
jgi:hypothetical protein